MIRVFHLSLKEQNWYEFAIHVTHCDIFNACISWPKHKKDGRVDAFWARFKDKYNLPDNDATKKWFNQTANARWKNFKSRVLKAHFDHMSVPETARRTHSDGFISDNLWGQLCYQFLL